jgi:hypothetical protein
LSGHAYSRRRGRGGVVGWAGIILTDTTDKGPILDTGDIARVRAGKKAVGALCIVQSDKGASFDQLATQPIVFLLRAIAPNDLVRLAESSHLLHPGAELGMTNILGDIHVSLSTSQEPPIGALSEQHIKGWLIRAGKVRNPTR